MKKLYKFYWDCGRRGRIFGIFAEEEQKVKAAIGKQCDFGSCLGKYSEIYGDLEEKDLTVLSDDQEFIKKFEELKCESGYNPLKYINYEN